MEALSSRPSKAQNSTGLGRCHVAFEADQCEPSGQTGWSVLLQGPASVVTNPEEVAKLSASPIDSWAADGSEDRFMRIDGTIVTGRPSPGDNRIIQTRAPHRGGAGVTAGRDWRRLEHRWDDPE